MCDLLTMLMTGQTWFTFEGSILVVGQFRWMPAWEQLLDDLLGPQQFDHCVGTSVDALLGCIQYKVRVWRSFIFSCDTREIW